MKRPLVVLALALAGMVLACEPFKPVVPSAPPAVTLWGDSFGESVAPYLGYNERVMGGTAPCDWIGDIAGQPAPRTAVLVFVGNKFPAGCDYRSAVATITQDLRSRGSRVVWVAAPVISVSTVIARGVNATYPNPVYGPADSVGGYTYLSQYRGVDGKHLSTIGAQRFAHEIRLAIGS
jgi:hypothetical protein